MLKVFPTLANSMGNLSLAVKFRPPYTELQELMKGIAMKSQKVGPIWMAREVGGGVLVIHCGWWILVIRSNQAKTQFLLTAVELE